MSGKDGKEKRREKRRDKRKEKRSELTGHSVVIKILPLLPGKGPILFFDIL